MRKIFAIIGMLFCCAVIYVGVQYLNGNSQFVGGSYVFAPSSSSGAPYYYDSGYASFGGDFYSFVNNNAAEAAKAAQTIASNQIQVFEQMSQIKTIITRLSGYFLIAFGGIGVCLFGVLCFSPNPAGLVSPASPSTQPEELKRTVEEERLRKEEKERRRIEEERHRKEEEERLCREEEESLRKEEEERRRIEEEERRRKEEEERLRREERLRKKEEEQLRKKEEERPRREEEERRRIEEEERLRREEEERLRKEEERPLKEEEERRRIENEACLLIPDSVEERQKLAAGIAYAINLVSISKARTKLKMIETESSKDLIEYLLSLPDDALKPVGKTVLAQLKNAE